MTMAWPCWRGWIRAKHTRRCIALIPTGSPSMPRANLIRAASFISPASTARTTSNGSRTSCARSSSARSPKESPTTSGAAWIAASICYCQNCVSRFRKYCDKDLPSKRDWNDPAYRQWIEWSYARRIEQWEFNNRVTRDAGGKDCLWIGMNGSGVSGQASSFRDLKEICDRAEMIMLDNQGRSDLGGFQENAMAGKMLHSLLGWDKLIPESMAMYQQGRPQFRLIEQIQTRGADVDAGRFCRRDSAVVASCRCVSRRSPDVPHGRAGDEVASGQ